jgi:flagellar protein FlaI
MSTFEIDINKIFRRKKAPDKEPILKKEEDMVDIPGPTLETLYSMKNKPIKEIDLTYQVSPRHQYVRIVYDRDDGELIYIPVEPVLEKKDLENFQRIKSVFERELGIESVHVDRGEHIEKRVASIIDLYGINLNGTMEKVLYYLKRDLIGYGEIDLMMKDPMIEDISCNGPERNVFIYHRVFESLKTPLKFSGELRLNSFILKMAQISGRHVSILDPITDATLPDGSRINLTYSNEVTKRGSSFTIRRFKDTPISFVELLKHGTLSAKQLAYLWLLIEYGASILISGGTASGKTTLLNSIALFIRPEAKIVSLEDTSEINLPHENWIQSITRSGFGREEGGSSKRGGIGLYELLSAALRQRPEYILVGEVRGSEAYTLFQAIQVGHAAMGTIHGGSFGELVSRVESPPMNVSRDMLASLDLVIFVGRMRIGTNYVRRVVNMEEISGVDPDTGKLVTNNVFSWDPYNDSFKYNGKSSILENIASEHGIELGQMEKEMEQRERVINWINKRGMSHFKEVAKDLKSYYYSPKEYMEEVL